jgi:hypothetical protein
MDSENTETPEAPQVETPEAPEAEPEQTETQEPVAEEPEAEASPDEEPEAEGEGDEEPTDPNAPRQEQKHRRKGGYQRRIERLEMQLEERDAFIRQQLAASQQPAQQPGAPAKEQTPEEKLAGYVDNLVAQRMSAAREQERQVAAARELQEKERAAQAKYEDYPDAVRKFASSGATPAHLQAILTSSDSPEIMYTIAKDPEALRRFASLPPAQAYLEVGRLEAKLTSSTATPAKPKSAIRPPAPPTSVGGKAATRSLDDLPFSEWKKALRSKGR